MRVVAPLALSTLCLSLACRDDGRSPAPRGVALPVLVGSVPVSEEFSFKTKVIPSATQTAVVRAAYDGDHYLAVWADGAALKGSVVSETTGAVEDLLGVTLTSSGAAQDAPLRIAFDGQRYLVVWELAGQVKGLYVERNGSVSAGQPAEGFKIADGRSPVLAGGGGAGALVVWETTGVDGKSDLWASLVQSSTAISAAKPIVTQAGAQTSPSVAFGANRFFVAWQDTRRTPTGDIFGAFVEANGAPPSSSAQADIAISTAIDNQSRPAVSFDGAGFVVAWDDIRDGVVRRLTYATVDATGVIAGDPASRGTSLFADNVSRQNAQLAQLGGKTAVAWQEGQAFKFGFVGSPQIRDIGSASDVQVIAGSSRLLAAWNGVRYSLFDADGTLVAGPGEPLAGSYSPQYEPSIASIGTRVLVGWYGGYGILDAKSGTPIAVGEVSDSAVGVGSDGSSFLLINSQRSSNPSALVVALVLSRLGVSGESSVTIATVQNAFGVSPNLPISDGGTRTVRPAVAYNGSSYLAAWAQLTSPSPRASLSAAGINSDGSGTGPENFGQAPVQTGSVRNSYQPQIVRTPSGWLLIWPQSGKILGTPIRPNGVPIGTPSTDSYQISTAPEQADARAPAVADDGTRLLVVWDETNDRTYTGDIARKAIMARFVSYDGAAAGPVFMISPWDYQEGSNQLPTPSLSKFSPAVAFDGTNFLLAWVQLDMFHTEYTLYAARLDRTGNLLDGDAAHPGVPIAKVSKPGSSPVLTAVEPGRWVIAYERDSRVYYRVIGALEAPPDGGVPPASDAGLGGGAVLDASGTPSDGEDAALPDARDPVAVARDANPVERLDSSPLPPPAPPQVVRDAGSSTPGSGGTSGGGCSFAQGAPAAGELAPGVLIAAVWLTTARKRRANKMRTPSSTGHRC